MRRLRLVVVFASGEANTTLAYQHGWPAQMARDGRFDVSAMNVATRFARQQLRWTSQRRLDRADAIVLLHSVFSNERVLPHRLTERLASARPPKVFFVGNEYKLMPEKLAFAEELETTLLISQLSSPEARSLYAGRLGCDVLGLTSAGFDPELFAPRTPWSERAVDVGYRAFPSPWYLGHDEREQLAARVPPAASALDLVADVSLSRGDRFDSAGWAAFLDGCRAQVGSEAGGDFFDLDDTTRREVNAYLDAHPDASFADVHQQFFAGRRGVSGRALSGRIVEAAATKTVQLLLEGEYGGYFEPDVHYIPVCKDFSNLDAALRRLEDRDACLQMADTAYEVARTELTYAHLLGRFHDALTGLVR
jgi:hypothetical protein